MIELGQDLPAEQRIILANDTSNMEQARANAVMAREAGASVMKEGLELASAEGSSWEYCASLAGENDLMWVADAKINDISNTTAGIVRNLVKLEYPPIAITIHTHSGIDSMRAAQDIAGPAGIKLLGVTELTSIPEQELQEDFGFIFEKLELKRRFNIDLDPGDVRARTIMVHMLARKAARAGIAGLVASPKEITDPIKSDSMTASMLTMIPGSRSAGAAAGDQKNTATPEQAIIDGADTLVIGRQITGSEDKGAAFQQVVAEIRTGLAKRGEVA